MTKVLKMIPTSLISPSLDQPRTYFEEDAIKELALSIKENGLIQPIVVRPYLNGYQIVAGERRYRACKSIDMDTIPCIIEEYSEIEKAKIAIIENIQRENLTPIEEAKAFDTLIKEYHLTQSDLAKQLGKNQSTIANKLRLLNLDDTVKEALKNRSITERHARALLSLDQDEQKKILNQIAVKDLNVKQTEDLVKKSKTSIVKQKPKMKGMTRQIKIAVNTLHQALDMIKKAGVSVDVKEDDQNDDYVMTIRIKK